VDIWAYFTVISSYLTSETFQTIDSPCYDIAHSIFVKVGIEIFNLR